MCAMGLHRESRIARKRAPTRGWTSAGEPHRAQAGSYARLNVSGRAASRASALLRAVGRRRENRIARKRAPTRGWTSAGESHRAQARSYVRLNVSGRAQSRAMAPRLRMRRHSCALSFRCDAGDTQGSFLLDRVACFLTGAAPLLRDLGIPCSAPIRTVCTCPFSPSPSRHVPQRCRRRPTRLLLAHSALFHRRLQSLQIQQALSRHRATQQAPTPSRSQVK